MSTEPNSPAPSSWLRLFGYVRRAPWRYGLGAVLTLAYAASFQAIPLAVREIVAGLGEISEGALGPEHPNTRTVRANLEAIRTKRA